MTRLLLSIVLCLTICIVRSQSNLLMARLTTANGLSSNEVMGVWQDNKGFIWTGSTNSLQRFDGKRFMSFGASRGPKNFPSRVIQQVTGDAEGNLWLKAGNEYGIYDRSTFSFKVIPVKSGQVLSGNHELVTDAAGHIYIIYYRQAIVCYDKTAGCFSDKLPFELPKGWKPVTVFFDNNKKNYWLGCDSGLALYNTTNRQLRDGKQAGEDNPLLNSKQFSGIRNFYIDKSRRQWLIYWPEEAPLARYACYSEKTNTFTNDTAGLANAVSNYYDIRKIFETHRGVIWMYGDDVMMGYDSTQKRFINNAAGTVSQFGIKINTVYSMVEDREKSVWAATDAGLFSFSPEIPPVVNYVLRTESGQNNISSLHEINNQLWICSWGKGLLVLDSTFQRMKVDQVYNHLTGDQLNNARLAWSLAQSSITGEVWVGCQRGWLQVVDPVHLTGKMLHPDIFNNSTIRQIAEDKLGNIWLGTQSGRLVKYHPQKTAAANFELVNESGNQINKLFIDKLNRLWVCTGRNGLFCLDTKDNQTIYHFNSQGDPGKQLSDNYVTGIAQVNDSIFAIAATSFQLLNTNTGTVKIFSYADGVSSNRILGLVTDAAGNTWIGTSNGISRYNYAANNFIRYTDRDGFGPLEKVGESNLLFTNNMLAMAGRNQFSVFDPSKFNRINTPPPVEISDIRLFSRFLPVDSLLAEKNVSFNYKQHSLTFYFSSCSFLLNDKLKYFYKLSNGDNDWQPADNSLSANYTMLPPGKYSFQVFCETEQHVRSPITSFNFTIQPPFYERAWFIVLVALLILAEVFFIYRIRRNRREAVERMRTQVARDLHDDMGSTLSTINILSTMAEKKLDSDATKSQEYITRIKDNSHRMMEAMDDIVWSIKPSNDSMQKIAGRMREFSTGVLEAKNINLQFRVDENVLLVKLNMAARRDFFLVFKEAINNIAKYAGATTVSVQVSFHANRLVLMIKDDGIGFDAEKADTGNGLNNMQKRADNLNGRLSIQSKAGLGTQITLNIPTR